jgi:hypothetical protein
MVVARRNRRASRCAVCAELYRADAFQLTRAGLAGGRPVPRCRWAPSRRFPWEALFWYGFALPIPLLALVRVAG